MRNARRRHGFTLIELMIVITVIGILIAFILKAAVSGIRRAEHAATVALIAKLETALTDRIDALTTMRAEPTWAHQYVAGIWVNPLSPTHLTPDMPSNQRAQVIAQYDYLRAELPDVFVIDGDDGNYPLNFGATRFLPAPGVYAGFGNWQDYRLPLGAGLSNPNDLTDVPPVTGMRGASFSAAGALYKQLGYLPAGYDGADNNGDSMIDDIGESGMTAAEINAKLAKHKHKTARAECLYAVLVEGTGPLGSVFDKDDFNNNEVKDTDGDGLLEFVDGWGEPLQFYRWPIMYRSDSQKGFPDLAKITQDTAASLPIGPYSTVYESRELDPLDPNQQLVNPGWWGVFNTAYPWGNPRSTFASLFHTLIDPLAAQAGVTSNITYWDRSTNTGSGVFNGTFQRRAYYSHFLVLSGGPDKVPGTAMLGVDYRSYSAGNGIDERSAFPLSNGSFDNTRDATGAPVAFAGPAGVINVLTIENQAGKIDPNRDARGGPVLGGGGRNDTNTLLEEFGNDDVSNHNLHATGGPLPNP